MAECFEGWKKEDGNIVGACCCNCLYQRPIVGHPWNKNSFTKGRITQAIGYGCTCPEFDSITFFDTKHGMCEMHRDKDNIVEFKRVK